MGKYAVVDYSMFDPLLRLEESIANGYFAPQPTGDGNLDEALMTYDTYAIIKAVQHAVTELSVRIKESEREIPEVDFVASIQSIDDKLKGLPTLTQRIGDVIETSSQVNDTIQRTNTQLTDLFSKIDSLRAQLVDSIKLQISEAFDLWNETVAKISSLIVNSAREWAQQAATVATADATLSIKWSNVESIISELTELGTILSDANLSATRYASLLRVNDTSATVLDNVRSLAVRMNDTLDEISKKVNRNARLIDGATVANAIDNSVSAINGVIDIVDKLSKPKEDEQW